MIRLLLASIALSSVVVVVAGCASDLPQPTTGEGEGEGSVAEGEGEGTAGEGEGAVGEGEGEGSVGEGEGEGEGAGTREFQCQAGTVVAQTSCATDDDCAVGQIALDCCGSQQVTGVNLNDICSFLPAAGGCFQEVCDCVAQPSVADDGTHAADAQSTPTVACVNSVCTTSYPG